MLSNETVMQCTQAFSWAGVDHRIQTYLGRGNYVTMTVLTQQLHCFTRLADFNAVVRSLSALRYAVEELARGSIPMPGGDDCKADAATVDELADRVTDVFNEVKAVSSGPRLPRPRPDCFDVMADGTLRNLRVAGDSLKIDICNQGETIQLTCTAATEEWVTRQLEVLSQMPPRPPTDPLPLSFAAVSAPLVVASISTSTGLDPSCRVKVDMDGGVLWPLGGRGCWAHCSEAGSRWSVMACSDSSYGGDLSSTERSLLLYGLVIPVSGAYALEVAIDFSKYNQGVRLLPSEADLKWDGCPNPEGVGWDASGPFRVSDVVFLKRRQSFQLSTSAPALRGLVANHFNLRLTLMSTAVDTPPPNEFEEQRSRGGGRASSRHGTC